jgi:tRNA A37 threonylcarbamoyladenosine biosynthesis protein TsaE
MKSPLGKTKQSKSLSDTAVLAGVFLKNITPHRDGATIFGLSGDLGSGKTAFTKEVAHLLGIKKRRSNESYICNRKDLFDIPQGFFPSYSY